MESRRLLAGPTVVDQTYFIAEGATLATFSGADSLTLDSQPGDFVGGGVDRFFGPADGTFVASSYLRHNVSIAFGNPDVTETWGLGFAAPVPGDLTPGTYPDAARGAGMTAGLDVTGDGRENNTLTGQFTVYRNVFAAPGVPISFAADFIQHGQGNAPPLSGRVEYEATPGVNNGILAGATAVDGSPLQAELVDGPTHGTLALYLDGSFSYIPAAGYVGTDSFTYEATDGGVASNVATASITVTSRPAPLAESTSYALLQGGSLTAAAPGVLAGASDSDGGTLLAALVSAPSHGSLTLDPDGAFTYTPAASFAGIDQFTYVADEGSLPSAPATVSIAVAADTPPTAPDNAYADPEGATLTTTAGAGVNDTGVLRDVTATNARPLQAALVSGPSHGTLTLNPDGSFAYIPAEDFTGTDQFTYTAGDGTVSSPVATATIDVTPRPAPTAGDGAYSMLQGGVIGSAAPGLLANDSDSDGGALSALIATYPAHGNLSFGGDGSFLYTPAAGFSGLDSFTYRAAEGTLASAPATVRITVVPDPAPVVGEAEFTTAAGTALVTSSGSDSLTLDSQPGDGIGGGVDRYFGPDDGILTLNDGRTPGVAGFAFSDPTGPSVGGYYTLGFADQLGSPLAPGQYDGATRLTTPNADGPELDIATYGVDSNTLTGSFTVYRDVRDATGLITSFEADFIQHSEGFPAALTGRIEYEATPAADTGVLGFAATDSGRELQATLVGGPSHGSLSLYPDGSFSYIPAAGFAGDDHFTYTVTDGTVTSTVATATIHVVAATAGDDVYRVGQDGLQITPAPGLLANDSDTDNKPLSARLVSGPADGTLTLNSDGSFAYTPALGFSGTDQFTYQAVDGTVASPAATVSIVVPPPAPVSTPSPTTPAPTPQPASVVVVPVAATQGATLAGLVVATFTESDPLLVASDFAAQVSFGDGSAPVPGTIVQEPDGSFAVEADHTYLAPGSPSLAVIVTADGTRTAGASATATVLPVPVSFSGAQDLVSDTGTSDIDGVTRDRTPTYAGTAPVGYVVTLFFTPAGSSSAMPSGIAFVQADGLWSITAPPLHDGAYAATATAANPAGVTILASTLGAILVDTAGPKVGAIGLDPQGHAVDVTFQGDPAGLDVDGLLRSSIYGLAKQVGKKTAAVAIRGVAVSGPAQPRGATTLAVLVASGKPLAKGKYTFTVAAGATGDLAGNPLGPVGKVSVTIVATGKAPKPPRPAFAASRRGGAAGLRAVVKAVIPRHG